MEYETIEDLQRLQEHLIEAAKSDTETTELEVEGMTFADAYTQRDQLVLALWQQGHTEEELIGYDPPPGSTTRVRLREKVVNGLVFKMTGRRQA